MQRRAYTGTGMYTETLDLSSSSLAVYSDLTFWTVVRIFSPFFSSILSLPLPITDRGSNNCNSKRVLPSRDTYPDDAFTIVPASRPAQTRPSRCQYFFHAAERDLSVVVLLFLYTHTVSSLLDRIRYFAGRLPSAYLPIAENLPTASAVGNKSSQSFCLSAIQSVSNFLSLSLNFPPTGLISLPKLT